MAGLLENIHSPRDLEALSEPELDALCEEIRETIIGTVSDNGGHLASNLGVVELTVALALAFHDPGDAVIFDVGHQSYTYKLLTGRGEAFSTIRREDGLSGFPNRKESPYDRFTTGHSSTSISAALGISQANALQGKSGSVVAVIGDGALSGGLAFEGLNNAGRLHRNFIVVLNDNNMSISRNVGSMARYLTAIRSRAGYIRAKNNVGNSLDKLPVIGKGLAWLIRKIKSGVKRLFYNSTIFEDMGFAYYGPFDGHDIKQLRETLEAAKLVQKPVLLHVRTYKGKGYEYAEHDPSMYHGLSGFDVSTGDTGEKSQTFSDVFGETLCELAAEDPSICAVTAAMQNGTGLARFREQYKDRFFDVGIAEEHAVTFSGGLAVGGMLPVFAVYSTFLQRAYDQLIHDVALQGTKMLLAVDRAGIVGEDGSTHQGLFDAAYLQTLPGACVYSPCYFKELQLQMTHLLKEGSGLCAVRYPRGKELYQPRGFKASTAPVQRFGPGAAKVCLVTYGRLFSFAAEASERLKAKDVSVKLIKLNRIVPIAPEAVAEAVGCRQVFFFEEGTRRGGIGETFGCLLSEAGFRGEYVLRAIEDPFVAHAPMFRALEKLGLNAQGMEELILQALEGKEGSP